MIAIVPKLSSHGNISIFVAATVAIAIKSILIDAMETK